MSLTVGVVRLALGHKLHPVRVHELKGFVVPPFRERPKLHPVRVHELKATLSDSDPIDLVAPRAGA